MRLALSLCLAAPLLGAPPLTCPAGAPLGSFQITVTPPGSTVPHQLQTVNELLPGYKISYAPVKINTPDKKKARVSLILVPSDHGVPSEHGKVKIFDPQPASEAVNWTVTIRTQIAAIVYGPQGLDKGKVDHLVAKNDELIGQLADYAQKTEQMQALIQAITQEQQSLESGQSVNAAVVSFANQYPGARLDRTLPADQQTLALIHGVNPALSAYDPLAQNPTQRAAQSAGLAAAVAGLFFGTNVGLAASGGALLLNMHGLFFPNTEFRSSFGEPVPEHKTETALCGNKTPSATRTELAFLWAIRVPDAAAPEIALNKTESVPINGKATLGVTIKARDQSLAARVQDWKLTSEDGKLSVPATVKFNAAAKTLELAPEDPKLIPGEWKLGGQWDWSPLAVTGKIQLRPFSKFEKAHLTPTSHDRLTQSSGKCLVDLEGDDFEFVDKLSFKNADDKFAQPATLPFHLQGNTLETQLDPKSLTPGQYRFLIAQSDGKEHEVPFKVLPAAPEITNLPLTVNTGDEAEEFTLKGTGLDRIEGLSAEHATLTLGNAGKVTIKLEPSVRPGERIAVQMKVKDFEQPIGIPAALQIAGPRPEIVGVRPSLGPEMGVALRSNELPAGTFVSFAMDFRNTTSVSGIRLSCGDQTGAVVKLAPGSSFLSFNTATVGGPGCEVMAAAMTPDDGTSEPRDLGTIVRLPKIEAFEVGDQKAGENTWFGTLKGEDLDTIERVGWDSTTGTAVNAVPAPAGNGSEETLQVAVPWPAPAPHAPLYVWLRGEATGRLTKSLL
jgi:hypothetical protein